MQRNICCKKWILRENSRKILTVKTPKDIDSKNFYKQKQIQKDIGSKKKIETIKKMSTVKKLKKLMTGKKKKKLKKT